MNKARTALAERLEQSSLRLRPGRLAVVVGAGASGQAAARLLHAAGVRVRLVEVSCVNVSQATREFAVSAGMEVVCGEHSAEQFAGADLVVTSPGVPLHVLAPFLEEAAGAAGSPTREEGGIALIGEMELALAFAKEPVLGVTGTSGKTTTVSLAAAMLEEAGKKVFLGGNIGTPLSTHVLEGEGVDVLVLELSSFQLQSCRTLRPTVAVLLNLTENHLDHHKSMEEYTEAKFNIFALQTAEDLAILPAELAPEYQRRKCRARLEIFSDTGRFPETRLAGSHNAANAEAAFLACRHFGVTESQAARAVASFKPLRHRLELVSEKSGVSFVNDSKSTTVESLRAALASFNAPLILLAGGKFKGGDLASLCPMIKEKTKAVCLFGASRDIFSKAWEHCGRLSWDETMEPALARARSLAAPGDVVLLSPATSSFDLYENYKERGNHFCRLVREGE